ncbi:MAG: hypothetical protein Q4E51_02575 [Lachnospiraceae bacterium]|nr:hypothetical protein [Lachnospiraceae bacterium]
MGRDATYDDYDLNKAATMQETDRKCPQCGGTMDFDPALGKLHCPYCDYTEDIPEADIPSSKAEELDFETAEFTGNCDWGTAQKTVTCKSCGATTVYDALEVANECPYCGSNQVMEANDVKTLAPGGVVAFKITAKQAGERFKKWLSGKWFCPSEAKKSAEADAFKGVYLPYWTFDTDTSSTYTGEYGYHKKRKRNGQEETYTEWHNTSGSFEHFIDDELVCATTQHDPSIMASIEPYNTEDNKAYRPEYIAGFAAERYSIGLKEAFERAKRSIASKLQSMIGNKIMSEHNADTYRNVRVNTNFSNITYKYLMLPIWISSFTYKGKVYQFMVNGQTGKVGGKSPISALRVAIAVLIVIVFILLIAYLSS